MKTILAFFLAAWMVVWPLGANPLLMLAGSPPVAPSGPTQVASDNFDSYTDGYLLSDSSAWDAMNGGVYVRKPASDGEVYATGTQPFVRHTSTFSANQRSEAVLDAIGSSFEFCAIAVRCQSGANTRYQFQVDGAQYFLGVCSAGTVTSVSGHSGVSLALSVGDKIALEVSGTGSATRLKIQKYTSGAWSDVATNIDPGTYIDGGTPGIGFDNGGTNTTRLDDWSGYDL